MTAYVPDSDLLGCPLSAADGKGGLCAPTQWPTSVARFAFLPRASRATLATSEIRDRISKFFGVSS
jgi:hypothetical protein